MTSPPPTVQTTRWLLDTRALWPGDFTTAATPYLTLLPPHTHPAITRKFHAVDKRMALGSALLKHAFLTQHTGLPFPSIRFTRKPDPTHGKPAWLPPTGREEEGKGVDFNVSHAGGIVVLVGAVVVGGEGGGKVQVATDIIAGGSLAGFTEQFTSLLSEGEIWDATYKLPSLTLRSGEVVPGASLGRADRIIHVDESAVMKLPGGREVEVLGEDVVDAKLRRFWTFCALKEGYLKLGGEGLLAEWVTRCEFRGVKAPAPGTAESGGGWAFEGEEGDEEVEVSLDGVDQEDVRIEIQAFGEEFIITTLLRPAKALGGKGEFAPWKRVDLERDIMGIARG
ncbi:hypothetical protein EJ06DRAFT_540633 [Trichodelitschia bisporula]|uniref:holo-[acyl-carrier-protein] synthase n=1 Tax=Trichodelitschia bisporula TaxID=703511 RepID=A0A6G1IAG1_9PEZI|nr:hypothetical protein EJ06DRAFT_540633 [Trichodelitschia bisporula]